MVMPVFLAATAGRAAAHASVTAAVANHDGSAGMATGRIAHVEVLLHGVGSVKDGPATPASLGRSVEPAVFDASTGAALTGLSKNAAGGRSGLEQRLIHRA